METKQTYLAREGLLSLIETIEVSEALLIAESLEECLCRLDSHTEMDVE